MNKKVYIHYGSKTFEKALFQPIRNRIFIKPEGGLWASPVDAGYGWLEWCEDENFAECKISNSFRFTLKDSAKVFHIYSEDDLKLLPLNPEAPFFTMGCYYLDFEKIAEEFDAIEYHLSDEKPPKDYFHSLYNLLYGWDCDSILVLNKKVIKVVKE